MSATGSVGSVVYFRKLVMLLNLLQVSAVLIRQYSVFILVNIHNWARSGSGSAGHVVYQNTDECLIQGRKVHNWAMAIRHGRHPSLSVGRMKCCQSMCVCVSASFTVSGENEMLSVNVCVCVCILHCQWGA